MATSFSGGRSRNTRREPPTMGKQLVSFITCGYESSALFSVIYKAGSEKERVWGNANAEQHDLTRFHRISPFLSFLLCMK
jgi:hypothetical protein